MKKIILAFFLFLLLPFTSLAKESRLQGFVAVSKTQKLYVDYTKAKKSKATLIVLNGLTYSTAYWDSFVNALEGQGFGILRYDMKGMGKTMLNDPLPVDYNIPYTDQVEQLHSLLKKLNIRKAHFLGLSYGGAIAVAFANKNPSFVQSLILMAPFTEPLKSMDDWILFQVRTARAMNPWNPATDDELYDFFLRQFVYGTYPSAEPSVLENQWKLEAVYRMVQGIRKFLSGENLGNLPKHSVHLIVAEQDQYIAKEVLESFWTKIPEVKRASRLFIDKSEHKIPEAVPNFSAAWVKEILNRNSAISNGRSFNGSVREGHASSGDIRIPLAKD